MLAIVNCLCGESICHEDGRCKRCGKYRMLPRELAEKAKAIEKAVEDFKDSMIAWMNANKFSPTRYNSGQVSGDMSAISQGG